MSPKNNPMQDLALVVAVNCVRNTVIEDYHARGSLSQDDMKVFNKQVANNLYTFLTYVFDKPEDEWKKLLALYGMYYPHDWDPPELVDQDVAEAYKQAREMGLVSLS